MTIRDYCSCDSCGKHYRIRYGMSDQFPQKSSFFCSKCGEKLSYGFDEQRNKTIEHLTVISEDETAENVNLHPELLMDKAAQADPYHFATLDFMTKQSRSGDEDFTVMKKIQFSIVAYNKGWDSVAKNLRYVAEKRFDLIDSKYGRNDRDIKRKLTKKALEVSRLFLEGPWKKSYEDAISELENSRHVASFADFKDFLSNNQDNYIENLYEIMTDFAKVKKEMLVTLAAQKCEHLIAGHASTVDWQNIEKVYGDLYERYGNLVIVLTGINNLNSRGAFDQFNTPGFTFQRYLESDKAGRCKNFESNTKLSVYSEFYDASIRNGTHHKNSKIDKEKQEIILGIGKGGQTERRLSFVEYIAACNELHARCLIMLNLIFKIIYS